MRSDIYIKAEIPILTRIPFYSLKVPVKKILFKTGEKIALQNALC